MILWPFQEAPPEPVEVHYGNGTRCGPHRLSVPDPNDPGRCFYCLELLEPERAAAR